MRYAENSDDCYDELEEDSDSIIESIEEVKVIESDLINGSYQDDQHYNGCELENYKENLREYYESNDYIKENNDSFDEWFDGIDFIMMTRRWYYNKAEGIDEDEWNYNPF